MNDRTKEKNDMPDVPDPDFVGALCEVWLDINNVAYHLAYVRLYLDSAALRTRPAQLRNQEQLIRDQMQADVVICRAHLAAFFWQLEHIFEALEMAITRGQKEHGDLKYFWRWEKELKDIREGKLGQEINAYRNKGHRIPAIIGCHWTADDKFLGHFLPTIEGHEPKESIDLTVQLQEYFEFVSNTWLSFAPGDFKEKFPRDFSFPVTVPHSYLGTLPTELTSFRQLEVEVVAQNREPERSKPVHD